MDYLDLLSHSSASSTPQTPSPRTSVSLDEMHPSPDGIKPPSEFDRPSMKHFFDHSDYPYAHDEMHSPYWAVNSAATCTVPSARGSFLSDLYDTPMKLDELHEGRGGPDVYFSPPAGIFRADWDLGGSVGASSAESSPSVHHLSTPAEPHIYRRASFPYVRHDHDDGLPPAPAFVSSNPNSLIFSPRSDGIYGEPLPMNDGSLPLSADPSSLHGRPLDEGYASPHLSLHEMEGDGIKMESGSPSIVPTQYYRPPSQQSSISNGSAPTYMTHNGSIPVMHTDDAASKETQYLRRRCFNCHTTEPPSWRRSTLNPGKIVCNKCGLYERTHLRPRPHRFDELRATNKARKAAKSHGGSPATSPKTSHGMVKKEPVDHDFEGNMRRSSISSNGPPASNGHEWDDSGAHHYALSSAPSTTYNSPLPTHATVPRMSQSPPNHSSGPIRLPSLPNASLPDSRLSRAPEKSASTPYHVDHNGAGSRPGSAYFDRRPSLPVNLETMRRPDGEIPEVTGWQPVPMSELSPSSKSRKAVRKVAAS